MTPEAVAVGLLVGLLTITAVLFLRALVVAVVDVRKSKKK